MLNNVLAPHLEYDPSFNRITPVPSQILTVYYKEQPLNITLDSGATVSFIRLSTAMALQCPISPNDQLALLADEKTRLAALGEINITLNRAHFSVNLRALVVKNLQADCFGGTNFHKDNDIETRITTGQIKIHHKFTVMQTNPVLPLPATVLQVNTIALSAISETTVPSPLITKSVPPTPITIPRSSTIMPGASLLIPLPPSLSHLNQISLQPLFSKSSPFPPQICSVVDKTAAIINHSADILLVKKKSTMLATQAATVDPRSPILATAAQPKMMPPPTPSSDPAVQINKSILSTQQLATIDDIHKAAASAFDSDLSTGYNHHSGKYYANLRFKEDSRPEAKTLDVPQYNRQCASLQQALMDRLEHQRVLVNPHDHGIEVRSVSPSWVIQKGSAKSKPLKECTIDELRWVVAFNNLNSHLLPKPAKVSSLTKAVKFLARWKFHILADLHNSYFQIHVAKKYWCWLGVMTPYRGLRVLTRLGQGLLNSEGELDELLAIVLGDHLLSGICEIARDDIQVGGDTKDEAIENWRLVLSTLARNGLKVSPKKVRIFPESTEVYGVKLQNNTLSPSDHVLSTLGITSIEQLKTARDVNAWRGLYKTLLHNLPKLSSFMHPFDLATASMSARDKFTWSPELTAAFNAAQKHLTEARALALPAPHEQLILQPDGAQRPPAIGWVLYVRRDINNKSQLVPVQYCSAKLKPHMQFWSPCEIEAVATNIAVEQCAPWIMEASKPTYVCPDSKAVVQAANRMAMGKMSTNPRLQNLLACINRRPILFHHSSAKLGQHLLSDVCSRTPTTCTVQDCSIEKFIEELPDKVELMSATTDNSIACIAMGDADAAIIAATATDILSLLTSPSSAIPLGSLETWRAIQEGDPDSAVVLHCKKFGDTPRKKNTNPTINRFFSAATIKNGILVVPTLDKKTMRNVDKIVIPQTYLATLLTVIHMKCNHPSKYQMEQIIQRYFYPPPGLDNKISALYQQCFTCQSIQKLKPSTNFSPPQSPAHPGTHLQSDVFKHERQLILVTTDLFSNFTTSCFIQSEQKMDLLNGLIQTSTPIRRAATVLIRTDRAPALQALASQQHPDLIKVGIKLVLPDTSHNKNSNAKIDKIIQELQTEVRKMIPQSRQLTNAELAMATSALNNRIRKAGFTAGEIQFARDVATDSNLTMSDASIQQSNLEDRPRPSHPPAPPLQRGEIVFIKKDLSKMSTHQPFLVTNPGSSNSSITKILHSQPSSPLPIKFSPFSIQVKNSDLHPLPYFTPKASFSSQVQLQKTQTEHTPQPPPKRAPPWQPLLPPESDSDSDDTTDLPRPHHPPPNLPPPLQIQQHLLAQIQEIAALPQDHPILPQILQAFQSSRSAARNSLAHPQLPLLPPPPLPEPPRALPDTPPTIANPTPPSPPLPPRLAKLQAIAKLSRPIPQLEGAEPTPETTPDSSIICSSPPQQHHLSPTEPWSPSHSPTREPSLEWDTVDDTPSFNLYPSPPGFLHLSLSSPGLTRNRVYDFSDWSPDRLSQPVPQCHLHSAQISPARVYNLSDVLPLFPPPDSLPPLIPRVTGPLLTFSRLLRRLRRRRH